MKGVECERIGYKREGPGERTSASRYSVVKMRGIISGKDFHETQEPIPLEQGLDLATAKERVKVWRDRAGKTPLEIMQGISGSGLLP